MPSPGVVGLASTSLEHTVKILIGLITLLEGRSPLTYKMSHLNKTID